MYNEMQYLKSRSDKETNSSKYFLFVGLFRPRKQLIKSDGTGEFITQSENRGTK